VSLRFLSRNCYATEQIDINRGQSAEAGALYAEAERMQQESQSKFDLFYSRRDFQYCDWLLVPAELAAWQRALHQLGSDSEYQISDGLAVVERRAKTTLKWAIDNGLSLLSIALDHYVRGEHELTRKHLAEAQQIAERGPMPLFLADVHLHRARMFRDKAEPAKAAKLIRELGYGRRYKELGDAGCDPN
jgi:tetratricopeptide (TPR) repeat protein